MRTDPPSLTNSSRSGLRDNCLSFPDILAQSIANIAPTVTPTINAALVFASAGNGTWITYGIATLGLLFVGININRFAETSASPGSLYSYIARGLGSTAGVITGWSLILAYLLTAMAVACGFVNYGDLLLQPLGIHLSPVFILAICIGLAWYVAYKDIQLSTVLMLALEVASVGLILLLGLIVLFKKGILFDPDQLMLKNVQPSGIVSGLVLGIFSYVGFESATTLGDEAKHPFRTIPRAVVLSTMASGLFFMLISYVEVLGFSGLATPFNKSAAPMSDLAQFAGVSIFGFLITVGSLVSFFACCLASLNAGSRILFAMGRHQIFHDRVGRAHTNNKTPHIAVTIAAFLMFSIPAVTLMTGVKPLDAFAYFGTIATYGFLVAYILVSIAAPIYLARRQELKIWDVLISVISVGFMLIPVLGSIGIPGDSDLSKIFPVPAAPYNLFPYLFLLYLGLGITWFMILRFKSPQMIDRMGLDLESTHLR